jgi:hypothetical protein
VYVHIAPWLSIGGPLGQLTESAVYVIYANGVKKAEIIINQREISKYLKDFADPDPTVNQGWIYVGSYALQGAVGNPVDYIYLTNFTQGDTFPTSVPPTVGPGTPSPTPTPTPVVRVMADGAWFILRATSTPTRTPSPTRTPTMTPTSGPTWPAYDPDCSDGQCVFQVSDRTDDAGLHYVDTLCTYAIADPEIYFGECTNGQGITSGFRFPGVNLSQGAQIADAYLAFWVDGAYSDLLQLTLPGEASDNAAAFSGTSKPSDRPLTTAAVNWTVPTSDFWSGNGTEFRFTPNIASLVQEIVNRSGWGSGNAMVMIVKNIDSSIYRRVYAYDRELNTIHTARLVITLANP